MQFNKEAFVRRLQGLLETDKRKDFEIAKDIGIQRSSFSKYKNGSATPDLYVLVELAKTFGVTTDYLLGLTNAATLNTSDRQICDTTGLSMDALEVCKEIVAFSKEKRKNDNDMDAYVSATSDRNSKNVEKDNLRFAVMSGAGPLKKIYDDEVMRNLIADERYTRLISLICSYIYSVCNEQIEARKCANDTGYKMRSSIESGARHTEIALFSVTRIFEAIVRDLASEFAKQHGKDIEAIADIFR